MRATGRSPLLPARTCDRAIEAHMTDTFDANLARLGAEVPGLGTPGGNYVPWVVSGSHVFLAGQVPRRGDRFECLGKLGAGMPVDEAYRGARLCGLNLIVALRAACE